MSPHGTLRTALTILAAALLGSLSLAAPVTGQLRPLEPADWALLDDDWSVAASMGAALYDGQTASLAGARGRLFELGAVELSWRVGRAVVQLSGVGQRILRVDSTYGDPVQGVRRPTGEDLRDVGEVLVSTLVPLTTGPGLRTMLRFGTRLPVTDSEVGLGRDQTDFHALLGGQATRGGTGIAAELGLGIHGTHSRGYYEQVDVMLYALEVTQRFGWLRSAAGLVGQMDGLRGHSVRGNEDLQEARLSVSAGGSRWARVELVHGLRTFSPRSGLRLTMGGRW